MRGRSSARTGGSVGARGISVVARRARERGGARADDSVPASRWTREWTLRHEPQRADTQQTSQRAVCAHAAQVRCQAHDRQRPVYAIWGHPPPFHNGPWGFEDGSVLKTIVRFETVDVQRHAVLKTPPFQNAPAVSERLRFRTLAAFWKRRWLQNPDSVFRTLSDSKPLTSRPGSWRAPHGAGRKHIRSPNNPPRHAPEAHGT